MTVSRVLRNHPSVSVATRQRVHAALRDAGYAPNPLVSAFMTRVRRRERRSVSETLAYLSMSPLGPAGRGYVAFERIREGAERRARELGFRLDLFDPKRSGLSLKRIDAILHARGIRGLIVGPVSSAHGRLTLDWPHYAAATIGHSLLKPDLPRASNDQYKTILLALRELRKLGYRRPALAIPGVNDERVHYQWSAGFLVFQQRHGHAPAIPVFTGEPWTRPVFKNWLRRHRPDAILSLHLEVHDWLRELGVRIPDDVGYAHLDLGPDTTHLAGVDQMPEIVGAAAVDLVVQRLYSNEYGVAPLPPKVLLEGRWIAGPSVRRQPARPT